MLQDGIHTFLSLVVEGRTYLVLLPIYASLLVGERLAHALLTDRRWNERDGAANLTITGAYLGLDMLIGKFLPLALMAFLYEHARLFTLGHAWSAWLIAFLLHDLAWYIDHRLGHRVGLLWAMHHVHHSSEEFNTTVASRGFLLDNSLSRPMFYLLPVLGVSPFQFIILRIMVSVWGIAQHTRLVPKLPWLDRWLATPSSHRVHHGHNEKYIDRNYGEVLMLWDHLFGTYQAEEEEPIYGMATPIDTYNPMKIEVAGIRELGRKIAVARSWNDKLRCLFMPPEWSPDQDPASSRSSAVGCSTT